jgi:hypothetical protein
MERQRAASGRKLNAAKTVAAVRPGATRPATADQTFVGGIATSPDGRRLYAVHVYGQYVSSIDLEKGSVEKTVDLPAEPYTTLLSADGRWLFVSLWGGARVLTFDAMTLAQTGSVDVGEHPNALTLSPDGRRLFVACANTNAVWVVDVGRPRGLNRSRRCPQSASPVPRQRTLHLPGRDVANADNNTVAFVDISKPAPAARPRVHPHRLVPDGRLVQRRCQPDFVLSGRDSHRAQRPRPQPGLSAGGASTSVRRSGIAVDSAGT